MLLPLPLLLREWKGRADKEAAVEVVDDVDDGSPTPTMTTSTALSPPPDRLAAASMRAAASADRARGIKSSFPPERQRERRESIALKIDSRKGGKKLVVENGGAHEGQFFLSFFFSFLLSSLFALSSFLLLSDGPGILLFSSFFLSTPIQNMAPVVEAENISDVAVAAGGKRTAAQQVAGGGGRR